jgi:hypothetical protein
MYMRLATWPIALQLLVADGVPKLDVSVSCQGAAEAAVAKVRGEDLAKLVSKKNSRRVANSRKTGLAFQAPIASGASLRCEALLLLTPSWRRA